jgi:NitT/TauT family transport system permease protein
MWQWMADTFNFNKIILPAPSDIFIAVKDNYSLLLKETCVTLFEAILGFLLGGLVAYLLAILFVHSQVIKDALFPYAIALKSTPLIAIAPLLVLWFGNGIISKVVMSALVAFFPVLVNSIRGMAVIDQEVLELMNSLSASRWQVFRKIRFYNSLGYLFSALKTSSSLALVGAVIGEFTGATRGIGHLITTSSYYLETPLMFAGIVMISIGGILFFWLLSFLESKIVFWETAR